MKILYNLNVYESIPENPVERRFFLKHRIFDNVDFESVLDCAPS